MLAIKKQSRLQHNAKKNYQTTLSELLKKIIKAKTDGEANKMNGSNDKYKTAWEIIIYQPV